MSRWLVDGYPTNECLERLRVGPAREALEIMAEAWTFPPEGGDFKRLRPEERKVVSSSWKPDAEYMRFATCGWSGNEEMLDAYQENHIAYAMTWCLTARGGLHIFEIPDLEARNEQ